MVDSMFRRMHFVRRTPTMSKVEIPEGAKKEAEFTFLQRIVSTVEKYKIPNSMILNLDQTSLKYAPCSRQTLAPRSSKHVAISGTSNKKATTGTFIINPDGHCLPFQLIYGGKTTRNLPKFKFPKEFSLSVNEKAFLKAKFTEWLSQKIEEGLSEGKDFEDIDILLILSVLKPLHASWVVDLYNYLTTTKGKVVIENGWKKPGITEAIEGGYSKLQPLYPFESIDPLMSKENP